MSAPTRVILCMLLLGCLFVSLPCEASAEATAYYSGSALVLDGILDDWVKASPLIIDSREQLIQSPEYWTGPSDSSGTFYVMWDEKALYLAGSVADDIPFVRFDPYGLTDIDGLVLYLSTNPDASPDRLLYESTDFRVVFALDNDLFDTGIDRSNVLFPRGIATRGMEGYVSAIAGYEIAVKTTAAGFDFEMKIPFAAFANEAIPVLIPRPGIEIGFNLELLDLDQACPGSEATRLVWRVGNPEGTPRDWGTLRFAEAE